MEILTGLPRRAFSAPRNDERGIIEQLNRAKWQLKNKITIFIQENNTNLPKSDFYSRLIASSFYATKI